MPQPTPLKALLSEQATELDAIHQRPVSQREFLSSVSPLLAEGSPARSRPGSSAHGGSNRASPLKSSASSSHTPQKGAPSPTKSVQGGGNNAVAVVATEPASPPAPDAYMNDLPLPPYGSTAHLALHVTETLELALRILKKNQQVGRQLTTKDEQLLTQIASFSKGTTADPQEGATADRTAPHDHEAHHADQPMMAL